MISQFRSGVLHPSTTSSAGAGVHLPAQLRTLCSCALLAVSATLTGCGAGSSTQVTSTNSDTTTADTSAGSNDVATPLDSATDEGVPSDPAAQNDSTYESSTVGADVLLVVPAGSASLSTAQDPAIKFTALATATTTETLEARLRAASRNPVTADGGRSGIITPTNSADENLTGSVTVSWDPPLQNVDGTSVADLRGYRVYQGTSQQLTIIQELNETGAGDRRLTQIDNVAPDNACFAVTAVDTSLNESPLGDVVCKDIIVAAPPLNDQTPNLSGVTQLSSTNGAAEVRLNWSAPARSTASSGAAVALYSVYHGSQSQLFKINELRSEATQIGSNHQYDVAGITGAQACFALTARYTDGFETSLGEIVCVPLTHTAAPQPGDQLRPFNVSATMTGDGIAQVRWSKPNTVVTSADATEIDSYDLYQGSRSQVYKVDEINESGTAGITRSTTAQNVFDGSNCFALTATDESRRQSALSTIVCATLSTTTSTTSPSTPTSGTVGVFNVTAQETSPASVAVAWDTPELIAAGQPISNLAGYNIYQGSESQLFKVAEQDHVRGAARQQIQRTGVSNGNNCFALTAYDRNGFEAPLSEIVCANISGTAVVPVFGIVPPTELATSALGGSSTVTLSWLASGAAATGAADPNVHRYNIYQGNHDRLYKVRQVTEDHDADPRSSVMFTGVAPDSACFAITAQYRDLRESRLSGIVCREN